MLVDILGTSKRGKKGVTNWGRFQGLQIGARSITNRGSLRISNQSNKITNRGRDFKLEQRDFKSGQGLQIGAEHTLKKIHIKNNSLNFIIVTINEETLAKFGGYKLAFTRKRMYSLTNYENYWNM